ncbi:hypothetical protein ACJX0J_041252, partial [Zea mays]
HTKHHILDLSATNQPKWDETLKILHKNKTGIITSFFIARAKTLAGRAPVTL